MVWEMFKNKLFSSLTFTKRLTECTEQVQLVVTMIINLDAGWLIMCCYTTGQRLSQS